MYVTEEFQIVDRPLLDIDNCTTIDNSIFLSSFFTPSTNSNYNTNARSPPNVPSFHSSIYQNKPELLTSLTQLQMSISTSTNTK